MRPLKWVLVVAFLGAAVLGGVVWAQSSANFDLEWNVIAGGGGRSASGSYAVAGSIGQPVVGPAQSSGYRLGAGFWYGARAPALPTPTPTSTTPPTPTATATTPPTGVHRLYLPVLNKSYW